MTTLTYRPAVASDSGQCVVLRGRTRENAFSAASLAALGITASSWGSAIESGQLTGRVCSACGDMVGYGFGDRRSGEVVVLAVLPQYEGRGIGKALLLQVMNHLWELGHQRLFLACSSDPAHRSYGFYRHLGWRPTGSLDDNGDEVLEFLRSDARHRYD